MTPDIDCLHDKFHCKCSFCKIERSVHSKMQRLAEVRGYQTKGMRSYYQIRSIVS